ncbi:MAG: alpha/beta hydrolase [Verrucomicrobiales bacterium]
MNLWTGKISQWESHDGESFDFHHWEESTPSAASAGVLVLIHGISGDPTDFTPLAEAFCPKGWQVFAPAMRGEGRDPRQARRGDSHGMKAEVTDVQAFWHYIREKHGSWPMLLGGESKGALLCLHALAEKQDIHPDGLLLFSPVVEPKMQMAGWQKHLFLAVARLFPKKRVDLSQFADKDAPPPEVSRLPERQVALNSADYAVGTYTLRGLVALATLSLECMHLAPQIRVPTFLAHGGDDIFVNAEAVERFFHALPNAKNQRVYLPGSKHLTMFDLETPQVWEALDLWLHELGRIEDLDL